MLKDFKKFILRGNAVDLAIAVVIGAAFGTIVTSLVKDLITPLIGAIGGKPDFSSLSFSINHSKFLYGDFINALVSFLLIASAVFFFVIQPINKFQNLVAKRKTPEDPIDRKCPECLSNIPKAASRCMFCTAKINPISNL
ncbi:MAG TPA: large conductance mechanosensitive channel protein MscL [Candidatus Saccharimonadales bacterium]|jgi:large conductance mechanosensitive channel|nr:large conductance mechanosensitive channel protein MscL [Candidatus Saccharimonadales bacterium]